MQNVSFYFLHLEETELVNSCQHLADVFTVRFSPAETKAQQYLRGVVVITVDLLRRLSVRHILIGEHSGQLSCFLGIRGGLLPDENEGQDKRVESISIPCLDAGS